MGIFKNIQDAMEMRKQMSDYKKELEGMRVYASSKRNYVCLIIDGGRSIKSLKISDEAMRLKKEDLAKFIQETMKVASKELEGIQKKNFKNSPLAQMLQTHQG